MSDEQDNGGIPLPPLAHSGTPQVDPSAAQSAAQSTSLNPRLAPQDIEAERSVLGGVLLHNDGLLDVLEICKAEDFYRETHRIIYKAMGELSARNEPIDVIILANELRRTGDLERVGGPAYISSLDAFVPATGNLGKYAKIVRDKAMSRRLLEAAHEILRIGYEQKGTSEELGAQAEQAVFNATQGKREGSSKTMGALIRTVYQTIESNFDRGRVITGLRSGIDKLDKMTSGFQNGDLIVIAARPSMGKTAYAMETAAAVAMMPTPTPTPEEPNPKNPSRPAMVFSMEMSAESLAMRLFSNKSNVPHDDMRKGKIRAGDWTVMARAADILAAAPLIIDDTPALNVMEIRARVRRERSRRGDMGIVVVDYLQLMSGIGTAENMEQEIAQNTKGLKQLAKEMKCPVIVLSQLNRSVEKRDDKRPMMSDLRASGAIEQDADLIIFPFRPWVYDRTEPEDDVELIIAKQRNGPTGTVNAKFLRHYLRFENAPLVPGEQEEAF